MQTTARRLLSIAPILLLVGLVARAAIPQEKPPAPLAPDRASALDRISVDSLKGHLSFLASDLLEGRDTPSRGLDLAAEYIAAQFRRAGLEAIGDEGYFQTANWDYLEPDRDGFSFEITGEAATIKLGPEDVGLVRIRQFVIDGAPLIKVDFAGWEALKPEDLRGKAVLVEIPDPRMVGPAARPALIAAIGKFNDRMDQLKPALLLGIRRGSTSPGLGLLIDPEAPERTVRWPVDVPALAMADPAVIRLFDSFAAGPIAAKVSTHLGEFKKRPVKLRNVVGLLRGSDPALKETCVMVTAHYDHLGVHGAQATDRIFNGANDDGSGAVSVIEIASSLASLKDRTRRSILFVTFFGEEKGLLGSSYYGRHPIFPVDKTVADVNLEQVGRTDDSEGPRVSKAALTGFGYSGVSTAFVLAGEAEGVEVVKHPRYSDAFFGRSDNQALADLGVPAHTLCVAFQFADYHGAADHWDKVDYANMAKIDRVVARTLLALADDPTEPKWDETNPRAAKYLKAWKERRGR